MPCLLDLRKAYVVVDEAALAAKRAHLDTGFES